MTPSPGTSNDAPLAQPLGNGVYLIDTLYLRPGLAASHLVVDEGHAAFVDTGAAPAAPRLLAALDELGIAREQVDYLFLTHVHLDHAGGAGQMMQALPNARAVLHPRGAPHLIDPTRLIAGSIEVYGEALYRQLYGELIPIPAERVLVVEDRQRLKLGLRTFEFIDAPVTHVTITARSTSTTVTSTAATTSASVTVRSTRSAARSCCRPRRRCSSIPTRCTPPSTG